MHARGGISGWVWKTKEGHEMDSEVSFSLLVLLKIFDRIGPAIKDKTLRK
jgi:hypothetical protein